MCACAQFAGFESARISRNVVNRPGKARYGHDEWLERLATTRRAGKAGMAGKAGKAGISYILEGLVFHIHDLNIFPCGALLR